jgi:hypothetical protein
VVRGTTADGLKLQINPNYPPLPDDRLRAVAEEVRARLAR